MNVFKRVTELRSMLKATKDLAYEPVGSDGETAWQDTMAELTSKEMLWDMVVDKLGHEAAREIIERRNSDG